MSQAKAFWPLLLSTCLLFQAMILPVAGAPPPKEKSKKAVEERQTPLTPSQFSLAATRFIVLLPFLPLLMLVPGVTGFLMPMFLALQDRLTTIAPNLAGFNIFGARPGNNQAGTGAVSNQGVTLSTSTEAPSTTTTAASTTYFRLKRGVLKSPAKAINEGFREVFDVLSKADDALNLLTAAEPDCRRQAVCRLHHSVDPSIGAFLGNLIEVLKLESRIEKLDVSDFTKTILKEILQAANIGLYHQDCSSVFAKCKVTLKSLRSFFG